MWRMEEIYKASNEANDHAFFENDEKLFTLMALLYVAHCRGFVLMVIVIVKLFPRPDRPTNLQDQNHFEDLLVNLIVIIKHFLTSIEHEASYCETRRLKNVEEVSCQDSWQST